MAVQKKKNEHLDCTECENRPPVIMPENQEILELYGLCNTQWRTAGMGGILGLDYNAVIGVAKIMGIRLNDIAMRKIRAMEAVALEEIARSAESRKI